MAQAPTPRFSNEQKQPVVIQNKMPKADPADLTGQFGGGGSGTGATFRLVGSTAGNQTGSAQTTSSNPYPTGYTSGIPSGLDTASGPGASYQPAASNSTTPNSTTPAGINNVGNAGTIPGLTEDRNPWRPIGGGTWESQSQGGQPIYTASDSTYSVGGAQPNNLMANSTTGSSSYGTPNGGYYNLGASAIPYVQSRPPQLDPSSWSMFLGTPAGQQYMANNAPGTSGSPGTGTPNPMTDYSRMFNTGGGAGGGGGWVTVGNPSGMAQQNRPGPGATPPRDGVPGPQGGHWGQNRGWRQGLDGYQGPGPVVAPPGSGGGTPAGGGENAMYGRAMAPAGGAAQGSMTSSRPGGGTALNPAYTQGYQPLSTSNFWWLTPNPNDGPSNYEDPRYTGPRVPWPGTPPGTGGRTRLGGKPATSPPGFPPGSDPAEPVGRAGASSLPPFPQFDPSNPPNPQQLAAIMQDWYRQFIAATGGQGRPASISPQNPIQNPTWGALWPGWQGDELRNRPPMRPPGAPGPR